MIGYFIAIVFALTLVLFGSITVTNDAETCVKAEREIYMTCTER